LLLAAPIQVRAENGQIAAGILGGLAAGAIIGSAVRPPPPVYYAPAPVYAPPPPVYYAPPPTNPSYTCSSARLPFLAERGAGREDQRLDHHRHCA
jgi:hypothetical protein